MSGAVLGGTQDLKGTPAFPEDPLFAAKIAEGLKTNEFARRMELHPVIDSTNNRAREAAADGVPHGYLVAAEAQTAGRGRMGRSFLSPPGSGVYLSYVLRPAVSPEKAALVTSLAAVAVARAVESLTPAEVRIKWVNDLYLNGRKFCGILSEAGFSQRAERLEYVILGIGVNVKPMLFPPELREIATSLGNETGLDLSRNLLVAEITNQLEQLYGALESGAFLEESRRRSNVIGQQVLVIDGARQYPALATAIDDQGRLVVRIADGTVSALGCGEVSLKRLAP